MSVDDSGQEDRGRVLADRKDLIARFRNARAACMDMTGMPQVIRNEMFSAAFDACADVGVFNRRHKAHRIEPLAVGQG